MPSRTPTGIRVRHARSCPGNPCRCKPSYEAWIYSKRDSQKIRKSFTSAAAAKGWRADSISALNRGAMRSPTRRTVAEAAAAWLEGARARTILNRSGEPYKPGVLRTYEIDLRLRVIPQLGAIRLSDLRRADVQAFADRLVGDGCSPSKVHSACMPLRAICRHAIERDELAVNPTRDVRLPAVTGRRERVATPAETEELLAVLAPGDRVLHATAFYAGLRRGEARALRWQDVDLAENVIVVERSWDDREGPVAPKSRKGKRKVPMPAALRRLLLEHKLATGRDGADLVFGATREQPFAPATVRQRAARVWREAGLRGIGLHELRHSYVSLMHDAGFSLERIGDYVGHSSTYMTDHYRHLLEGHEAEAAKRFDEYLERLTGARSGAQAVSAAFKPHG
jgi:integrase